MVLTQQPGPVVPRFPCVVPLILPRGWTDLGDGRAPRRSTPRRPPRRPRPPLPPARCVPPRSAPGSSPPRAAAPSASRSSPSRLPAAHPGLQLRGAPASAPGPPPHTPAGSTARRRRLTHRHDVDAGGGGRRRFCPRHRDSRHVFESRWDLCSCSCATVSQEGQGATQEAQRSFYVRAAIGRTDASCSSAQGGRCRRHASGFEAEREAQHRCIGARRDDGARVVVGVGMETGRGTGKERLF